MKTAKLVLVFAALALAVDSTRGQSFQDLDFQSPKLPETPGGFVPFSSAFPGWTGYIGNTPTTQALYNDETTGSAAIDLLGPNYIGGFEIANYTAVLQAGQGPAGETTASIAQTGMIPSSAESLQFEATGVYFSGQLTAAFNGNNLPLVPLATGTSAKGAQYTVFGVDVSAYAGQTGSLEFTSDSLVIGMANATFSSEAVPEPGPAALAAVAGLLFAWRRFSPAVHRARGEM